MITTILFFIALVTALLMSTYRAWEIRTSRVQKSNASDVDFIETFSFRNIEKVALSVFKNVFVGIILVIAKYWFIFVTKTKKWLEENWPKVHQIFERSRMKEVDRGLIQSYSFMRRLILETRAKVRRMKEKVKREHE